MINVIGVKWGGGFFAPQGVEFELLLASAAGTVCLTGSGGIALDRAIPRLAQHKLSYGVGSVLLGVCTATIVLITRG